MSEKEQPGTNETPPIEKMSVFKKFPPQFWLVIVFEFFERGSYYGMMSVLAVYLTDILGFAKAGVGIITGTIQPILYFLPIISGALADRFGYRRLLTIAFTLLGAGYFLTSQMTSYTAVFLALGLLALGAGTFKPIISGSIARMTTKENSTLGFGIFYWTINLGAFLFPLILVPLLKNNIGWNWVLIASALGTGAMLIPTLLFFKEPPKPEAKNQKAFNLIRTVANAFEIIYSPLILLHNQIRQSKSRAAFIYLALALLLILAVCNYHTVPPAEEKLNAYVVMHDQTQILITIDRNVMSAVNYRLKDQLVEKIGDTNLILESRSRGNRRDFFEPVARDGQDVPLVLFSTNLDSIYNLLAAQLANIVPVSRGRLDSVLYRLENKLNNRILLTIYKPESFANFQLELRQTLNQYPELADVTDEMLANWLRLAEKPATLRLAIADVESFKIETSAIDVVALTVNPKVEIDRVKSHIVTELRNNPQFARYTESQLGKLVATTSQRAFFFLFVMLLAISALLIIRIQPGFTAGGTSRKILYLFAFALGMGLVIWLLPGLSTFGRIISSIIYFTVFSLFLIDFSDAPKFSDHFKFLSMIFIYSGFWILYFQMFGSVLWYVKAYVDASSLNSFINNLLGALGIHINWFFDVEHVTVINAGTIILLQLLVSNIVKNTKALPTMITGFLLATVGMTILAISTGIWVFMIGIIFFSIGEMTAHPKFISYVGQTAPRDRVALYMGYIFLYGVLGSSIGSVLGARMYVHFVDQLHQPKVLWLLFSGIGVLTIVGLLLYNKFFALETPAEKTNPA